MITKDNNHDDYDVDDINDGDIEDGDDDNDYDGGGAKYDGDNFVDIKKLLRLVVIIINAQQMSKYDYKRQ